MNENSTYKIIRGVSVDDYSHLIISLYKEYPSIIKIKINEFKKAFSLENPFFKYGTIENFFIFNNDVPVGHISAIIDDRIGDVGLLGFFECKNKEEIAHLLFQKAIEFLKDKNKKKCCGPINISTWQSFRVSFGGEGNPFFLEPFTLPYYRELFMNNIFVVSHKNSTTFESIENTKIKEYEDFYIQSLEQGFSYEVVGDKTTKEDILDFYYLTNEIYKDSYLFRTISKEEFLYFADQYMMIPKPNYIFLLKDKEKKSIGFFFATPDILNPEQKRVVLKTTGVVPSLQGRGLGKAMLYFIYKNAKEDGFKELLFSTMAVENEKIQELTGKESSVYRRYEVYEKEIV